MTNPFVPSESSDQPAPANTSPATTSLATSPEAVAPMRVYGGIRRRVWLYSIWPLALLWELSKREGGIVGFVIFFIIILVLLHYRAKNIGLSRWAWTWGLVPLANLYFLAYCVIVPKGYADSRKLDTTANCMLLILLGIVGLFLLAIAADIARQVLAN